METIKRKKSSINVHDSVDRISELPDSILSFILSFLFTKNAVATSVLSKRWKSVWTTVHNLYFWDYGYSEGEATRFVEFVNRVFLQHDPRLLIAFGLVWKPRCSFFHVNSWIRTAITRNVHSFFLDLETRVGPDGSTPQPIVLPLSVFNCYSLQSLELTGGISFANADMVCLPRLVNLKLVSVNFESEEAFEKFIIGFPVLDHLHLHTDIEYMVNYFEREENFTYVISSTSLRYLDVCFYNNLEPEEYLLYCSLELKASSIEYLKLDGFLYDIRVQGNLSSLIKADIGNYFRENDFFEPNIDSFVEVVRALNCAKTLTLSGDAMWALSCTRIRLATEFKRLVNLETTIYCCYCSILRELVQSSDSLEVLTIYQHPNYQDRNDRHNHSTWRAPVEVPRCLSNSLKKVVIDVYYGFGDEREMISYLLKHGSVLELMKISLDSYRENAKFELLQEISMLPRKSPACKIEFVVD